MDGTEFNGELIGQFLELVHGSQKGIKDHPDYSLSKNNFHLLSPKAKYAQQVFNYYSKVMDVREDLIKIEIFLRRFPFKKFYEENDIDFLSYTKYHMEVFFHKINTLLDLLKLMLNEAYELQLSERKCSWEKLVKNETVKDTGALKIIEYFHKSFEHIITARHLNTHRGIFHDSENDDIRIPMMIYKNSEKFQMDVGEEFRMSMPKFILDYRLRKYKKDKLSYIKKGNEVATQYLNLFMNVLLPEVIARAEKKIHP